MFWTNQSKFRAFHEILNFYLDILTNFEGNLTFFHFSGFGLFETAYDQIWPFNFFEPGKPAVTLLLDDLSRRIGAYVVSLKQICEALRVFYNFFKF
jgi:hypothetical protein